MSVKLKVTLLHLTNHNKHKWQVNQSKPSKFNKSYIVGAARVKRGKLYIFDGNRRSYHKGNPVTYIYIYHIHS